MHFFFSVNNLCACFSNLNQFLQNCINAHQTCTVRLREQCFFWMVNFPVKHLIRSVRLLMMYFFFRYWSAANNTQLSNEVGTVTPTYNSLFECFFELKKRKKVLRSNLKWNLGGLYIFYISFLNSVSLWRSKESIASIEPPGPRSIDPLDLPRPAWGWGWVTHSVSRKSKVGVRGGVLVYWFFFHCSHVVCSWCRVC